MMQYIFEMGISTSSSKKKQVDYLQHKTLMDTKKLNTNSVVVYCTCSQWSTFTTMAVQGGRLGEAVRAASARKNSCLIC
jgi:hypothetical protein